MALLRPMQRSRASRVFSLQWTKKPLVHEKFWAHYAAEIEKSQHWTGKIFQSLTFRDKIKHWILGDKLMERACDNL